MLPHGLQYERDSLSRSFKIGLELVHTILLDLLRQAPAKVGDDVGCHPLHRRPVLSFPQDHILLNLHNFDMIQVLRRAVNNPPLRIHLTLLHDPSFRATDELLWEPSRNGSRFLDKSGCFERALVCEGARYDVACEYVGRVWVWVAQEVGEGDDLPGVVVSMRLREYFDHQSREEGE